MGYLERVATLLLIDDDDEFRESLMAVLESHGHTVFDFGDATGALKAVETRRYDVVFLDLGLPDRHGLEVLAELKQRLPATPVIVLTGDTAMASTVRAMRDGAFDFLGKQTSPAELEARIDRALEVSRRGRQRPLEADEPRIPEGPLEMIGTSASMREVFKQLGLLAGTRATVMIRGESGTGKELAARVLHEFSCKDEPFVGVNCAALPGGLVEAELFGHRKGAFTGAERDRMGKLEAAGEGTLFLDEVGEVPLAVQVKLLRVIQERRFERLGETESRPFRARVVTATHRDLEAMVRAGEFREDLYYRLNVATVTLPPLRARREDVPGMARVLLASICREVSRPGLRLTAEALERLQAHDWPGNVRELRNVLTRAVVQARGDLILSDDLVMDPAAHEPSPAPAPERPTWERSPSRPSGFPTLAEVERDLIRTALERTGGHRGKVCAMLGLTRPRLLRKIRSYKLERGHDDEMVPVAGGADDRDED